MLLKSVLNEIIYAQRNNLSLSDTGLKREVLQTIPDISSHALVVSGVRRCGKSTLLFQLLSGKFPEALYVNFEDPRLYEFEQSDFSRLDQIITDLKSKVLLFDEIQIIDGWEKYIRQKLEENFKPKSVIRNLGWYQERPTHLFRGTPQPFEPISSFHLQGEF